MGNGTLDPRSLTSEERAWCDAIAVALCSSGNYSAAGAISEAVTLGLPERRALFGEPASEGGKVECPNCREQVGPGWDHEACNEQFTCKPAQPESEKVECPNCHHEDTGHAWKVNGELRYSCKGWNKPAQPEHLFTCRNCGKGYDCDEGEHYIFASGLYACLPPKPAQPEPVAEEMPPMPNAVHNLVLWSQMLAASQYGSGFRSQIQTEIEAFTEWWRTHSAQPAKVRMTKELRRALDAAEAQAGWHMDQGRPKTFDEIDAAIAAVRLQAAEAGKVTFTNARHYLAITEAGANVNGNLRYWRAALAELDAAEGKVAG